MMRSAGVYILLAACAVVLLVSRGAFGFYDDSGIHLLQASMAQQGFRFYTEMPFDHPHGLTYLLLGWFSIFGTSHLAAQLLTISFSLLLFWAVFMVASLLRDEWAGHLSVLLLVSS